MRVPEEADRDFVAGAFILKDGKVLMLKHKKYGVWLQPGGHVEPGETPDEAAVRETREETGLEVEILQDFKKGMEFENRSTDLPMPFNINLHRVEEKHWHCDFQYVCRVEAELEGREYTEKHLKWFDMEELKEVEEMPENARKTALEALEKF